MEIERVRARYTKRRCNEKTISTRYRRFWDYFLFANAVKHMAEREDYLGEHYWMPKTF